MFPEDSFSKNDELWASDLIYLALFRIHYSLGLLVHSQTSICNSNTVRFPNISCLYNLIEIGLMFCNSEEAHLNINVNIDPAGSKITLNIHSCD